MSGGPGAGKTTVLTALEESGYPCVPESARSIIRERLAAGLSPRPDTQAFARSILDRDIEQFEAYRSRQGPVFFDRGIVDALGMCVQAGLETRQTVPEYLQRYPLARFVFMLPPWQEIYRQDDERDQTYEDAIRVSESLTRWYEDLGFEIVIVPQSTVLARRDFIIEEVARRVPAHQ